MCTRQSRADGSSPGFSSEEQPVGPQKEEIEIGAVPLVGGDTDVGVGVGFLGSVARIAPEGAIRYAWRVESGSFVTFKSGRDGLEIPYFQGYLVWTQPRLWDSRLRLDLRLEHVSEANMRYFGIGNASVRPPGENSERDLYTRTRPTFWGRARMKLPYSAFVGFGASASQNWITVPPNSTLAQDLRTGSEELKGWLRGTSSHGVLLGEVSAGWDTRDDDIDPTRGQYHQVTFRASPHVGGNYPFSYQQLNTALRFYVPLVQDRMVGVLWSGFDALFGTPPFYELARFDETFAIGGNQGVRGVPGQRYYGKVKVMASAELRTRITKFDLFGSHYALGIATFADTGRLWADFSRHPELDGTTLGLKYGIGGGLRLHQGKTFVVRADVAWSPDARPIGAYVLAGHAH